MKTLKVYDEVHREVKSEAAKTGRPVPNMGSALLRAALDLLHEGKIELPPPPTQEPTAASSED